MGNPCITPGRYCDSSAALGRQLLAIANFRDPERLKGAVQSAFKPSMANGVANCSFIDEAIPGLSKAMGGDWMGLAVVNVLQLVQGVGVEKVTLPLLVAALLPSQGGWKFVKGAKRMLALSDDDAVSVRQYLRKRKRNPRAWWVRPLATPITGMSSR